MKWQNKGHEFDEIVHDYHKRFGNKDFFVFGTGMVARGYAGAFRYFGELKGFVDNNKDKQGESFLGKTIISFADWLQKYKNDSFLLVCVGEKNYDEIKSQLMQQGLLEGRDYIWHAEYANKIFPVMMQYDTGGIFLPLVQISLTERCTLKCKKCAHACHLVPSTAVDLSLEDVCHSADSLFSFVDFAQEFVLIGGEPLLYNALDKAIEYIGSRYRDKIGIFSITTNGTVTPNDEVLNLCKRYNVFFRISNYSKTLQWIKSKHEKLVSKLKESGVEFALAPGDRMWMDYGFEYVDRKGNSRELIDVFDKCNTPCHEIRGDKFYYCVMARTVSENMGRNVGKNDYLDLSKLNPVKDKRLVFEYMMGYSDKGYLDMCNYCHGADSKKYVITVAEQVKAE